MPDRENLYRDDIEALRVHRENYGLDGPKKLQILWWEWQERHWKALRLKSLMNFINLLPWKKFHYKFKKML